MAQELLTTFPDEIGELALVPGTGGVFEVRIGDEVIWSRVDQGRFPDIKELKQLVRDRIAPAKDLGHSEKRRQKAAGSRRKSKANPFVDAFISLDIQKEG